MRTLLLTFSLTARCSMSFCSSWSARSNASSRFCFMPWSFFLMAVIVLNAASCAMINARRSLAIWSPSPYLNAAANITHVVSSAATITNNKTEKIGRKIVLYIISIKIPKGTVFFQRLSFSYSVLTLHCDPKTSPTFSTVTEKWIIRFC